MPSKSVFFTQGAAREKDCNSCLFHSGFHGVKKTANQVFFTSEICEGKSLLLRSRKMGTSQSHFPYHLFHTRKISRATENTKMSRITATLPYPPSVNHYWRTVVAKVGRRHVPQVYVSADGERHQRRVATILAGVPKFTGPVRVQILVQPPDKRTRDLDNVLKCLLDSVTKAGLWGDDGQIDSLLVVRGERTPGGLVTLIVEAADINQTGQLKELEATP